MLCRMHYQYIRFKHIFLLLSTKRGIISITKKYHLHYKTAKLLSEKFYSLVILHSAKLYYLLNVDTSNLF